MMSHVDFDDYLLQMTVWWRSLFPLCCILSCVQLYCASSVVPQKAKYNYSFRLTRLTRTGVQRLLNTYVSELDWPVNVSSAHIQNVEDTISTTFVISIIFTLLE